MSLDLLNDLVNKVKESDFVNNFIDELTDYLKNANEKGETQLNNEQNNNLDVYRQENCLVLTEFFCKIQRMIKFLKKLIFHKNF